MIPERKSSKAQLLSQRNQSGLVNQEIDAMAETGARRLRLQQITAEDRRLRLLQLLADCHGGTANEHVLAIALPELWGHYPSRDMLRNDLMWLNEMLLIELLFATDIWVAKLLSRGEDVALGRARAYGVITLGAEQAGTTPA